MDLLSENEKRKISATLSSKRYNFVMISTKTGEGIEELKEKLFQSFEKLRIYTKEPNKKEKSPRPIILPPESTVKHVAEKILKGFSSKIKETRIWGPSSKYPGQVVGLAHKLKDMDVVEFKTG
jgi:ribosome-interacting GTPase 1